MNQDDITRMVGDFKRYISYLWNHADDILEEHDKFKVEGMIKFRSR